MSSTKEKGIIWEGTAGTEKLTGKLRKLAKKYEHLKNHLKETKKDIGLYPELVDKPESQTTAKVDQTNVIFRLSDLVFSHVYVRPEKTNLYYVVEPELDEKEWDLYQKARSGIVKRASGFPTVETEEEYEERIDEIFDQIFEVGGEGGGVLDKLGGNSEVYQVSQRTYDKINYMLKRDIARMGPLDPLLQDKTNEDISVVGPHRVYTYNKLFGLMKTNVDFGTEENYKELLKILARRGGSKISETNPIVDTVLPDGSRMNIIYPEDVSVEGPSLTIRQFDEVPPSIFQIVKWGTMSPELAAYLWTCLESNVSAVVAGETAAGKTTSLGAITAFIEEGSKIYTAEDVPEVKIPHKAWQRLLTREGGENEVPMFDLVKAALRSRPDYIIVGEVRGKEAFNVFQAMQTGHPTLFTFHAGNVVTLVNRFTGRPLNVPEPFLGNLNVAVFQNFIKTEEKEVRRVTSVQEIEGFSEDAGGIVTSQVFNRDPARDKLNFPGKFNSNLLETKVATTLGYTDPRKVYDEIDRRAIIIQRAITEGIIGYYEVVDLIRTYQMEGVEGLPFNV